MISVIVPAFNAATTIGACVDALVQQTVPADRYEVIVVDDGSTDDTAEVASRGGARVVSVPHGGPAAARNAGLAAARGEIMLFTDADCVPAPDWIEEMARGFASGADGVKGAYLTRQRGLLPRFVQFEFEERYRRQARAERIDFIDTYAAGFRRDVLTRWGGFDPMFPAAADEDVDLSYRLAQQGCRLVFAPAARVYHRHSDRLLVYVRRKFRVGFWRVFNYLRFPGKVAGDSYTPKAMIVQIGLVGLGVLGLLGAVVSPWAVVLAAGALLLHLASTLPFALRAARRDPLVGALAPWLLLVRSAAQGFGFAAGIAFALAGGPHRSALRPAGDTPSDRG